MDSGEKGVPYWSANVEVHDALLTCFRSTLPGPGTYRVVVRIGAKALRGKRDKWYVDEIVVLPSA